MNMLTYFVSLTDNIVRMTHHISIIHEEIGERLYNVSMKHKDIVNKILTTINPEAMHTVIQSMSGLNFTEVNYFDTNNIHTN